MILTSLYITMLKSGFSIIECLVYLFLTATLTLISLIYMHNFWSYNKSLSIIWKDTMKLICIHDKLCKDIMLNVNTKDIVKSNKMLKLYFYSEKEKRILYNKWLLDKNTLKSIQPTKDLNNKRYISIIDYKIDGFNIDLLHKGNKNKFNKLLNIRLKSGKVGLNFVSLVNDTRIITL